MEYLGHPFSIQNTADHGWLVTWNNALTRSEKQTGEIIETISFTVAIPRNAALTISEVQGFALRRAEEMIQDLIRKRSEGA